mmetsp:Transcript_6537/g.23025  ORF Transcript_6537/g.23025 Transcript_6537/m.23025 type:complete len:310 (-) Transcript_6537:308-1237(-)
MMRRAARWVILSLLLLSTTKLGVFFYSKYAEERGRWTKYNLEIPEFDGEFGHELDRAIPYAYKMFTAGRVKKIKYMKGLCVLYESLFPQSILEQVDDYARDEGNGKSGWVNLIGRDNHNSIDSFPWLAPNWRGRFKHMELKVECDKELLIIHNKYTSEWFGPPVNFISLDVMKQLHASLSQYFTVIVIHPTQNARGYTSDHQHMLEPFDYSGMYTIQDVMRDNPELDYNTVQFVLHDRCKRFISLQGGSSRVASMFDGTNIVLHVEGYETKHNEYKKVFSRLSDVKIVVVHSETELADKALEQFVRKES